MSTTEQPKTTMQSRLTAHEQYLLAKFIGENVAAGANWPLDQWLWHCQEVVGHPVTKDTIRTALEVFGVQVRRRKVIGNQKDRTRMLATLVNQLAARLDVQWTLEQQAVMDHILGRKCGQGTLDLL